MNDIIERLLKDVALPRMVRARQVFADRALPDVAAAVREQMRAPAIASLIRPGASIALGVGSRGLAELPLLVRTIVEELKHAKAVPFIVPAMGSHGGATAQGQVDLLAALGVTEASAGCEIRSSMETVEIDVLPNGLPVHMDANALKADGIVVLNRVKPHTSFSGPNESGLAKMLSIGLGKQKGAESCHALGFATMAQNVSDMARVKIAKTRILFGVATVENAYERIAVVEAVPAERILERDAALLEMARGLMPRLLFNPLDVLVIDRMGKEFSGTGMDPNITGRASTAFIQTTQRVSRMVVLDLSDRSKGNATGMGLADVCTRRLFGKIDLAPTYANHITAAVIGHAKIPMIMESDRRAVQVAVRTSNVPDLKRLRLMRIPNTLHLEHVEISEGLLDEAKGLPEVEIAGELRDWAFDVKGELPDLGNWPAH
jgi:Lactate racemase N-terminal domain